MLAKWRSQSANHRAASRHQFEFMLESQSPRSTPKCTRRADRTRRFPIYLEEKSEIEQFRAIFQAITLISYENLIFFAFFRFFFQNCEKKSIDTKT